MTWRDSYTTEDHSRHLSQHHHLSLKERLAPLAGPQAVKVVANDDAMVLVEVVVHRLATIITDSLDFSNY